jgi:hypothetical protein
MLWSECLELTIDGRCDDWKGTCSALANVTPLSGWRCSVLILLPRSFLRSTLLVQLSILSIVGLEEGRMDALGRLMIPRENTEKNGLAQGTVAEMTLTWQASSDMTWSLITYADGFSWKMVVCIGRSREALGAIRRRREAKAITTFAFVLTGMLMS